MPQPIIIGPELHTARLTLRVPRIEDFDRYAEVIGDEAAARYIGGHQPRAGAWRRFLQMPGAWVVQGFAMFSVIETASGRWLGQAGPWQPDGWPGTEVGFVFHPDAWGQGYAREAATAAIDWAFDTLGWDEVIHCIDPDNVASQRLAQRLGSVNSGPGRLPPPNHEHAVDIWRQSAAQWRARRADEGRA
ncbi:GNAT family N-acetyltransferase [Luteimonas sp. BDR2-5]|uniref:GNAT family N-acetyltransferase n=1 Tax=Proluteimonas luteida TaxID=2878685 RepID=UPI001E5E06E9|nr:GNAT family N-acetyltransferase [Luteimonas sp. BDR2-5]MCD9028604.1 GNAT family N-acetyltransferase [Luteimonas sp. BDR2-5]